MMNVSEQFQLKKKKKKKGHTVLCESGLTVYENSKKAK